MNRALFCMIIAIVTAGCTPSMDPGSEKKVENFGREVNINKKGVLHTVPLNKILQVLPLRGNVPALSRPKFVSAEEGDGFLSADDSVIGLRLGSAIKAYPVKIMRWHQVANDVAGDEPLLISYDPISDMGTAYRRKALGEEVSFEVTDKIYNSNPLLKDPETKTTWSQHTGEAVMGRLAGQKLEEVPLLFASWGEWKKLFPKTEVLSIDTGFQRNYDKNVYEEYYSKDYLLFEVENEDSRLPNKEHVYGIRVGNAAKAYPAGMLKRGTGFTDRVGGVDINIAMSKGGIFMTREVGGRGDLAPRRMFWFAWAAFNPGSDIWQQEKAVQ